MHPAAELQVHRGLSSIPVSQGAHTSHKGPVSSHPTPGLAGHRTQGSQHGEHRCSPPQASIGEVTQPFPKLQPPSGWSHPDGSSTAQEGVTGQGDTEHPWDGTKQFSPSGTNKTQHGKGKTPLIFYLRTMKLSSLICSSTLLCQLESYSP